MTEQFMENISNEEHERLLLLCGHGIGDPLSPAAQAVRDAFDIASIDTAIFGDPDRRLAAALRAAADQIAPVINDLGFFDGNCCERTIKFAQECIRDELLAIATELESLNA